MASPSKTSTIFVGSSFGLDTLSASAIANPLLADGDVSFYGHMSGVVRSYMDGTEQKVVSTWAGTGAGLTELNEDPINAVMRVNIANTSGAAIVIPVGTLVSSASGIQYQIALQPTLAQYWSQGSGGAGIFTIPAGQSISVLAQALAVGTSGNLADNQVTQIGINGASIVGSSLDTAVLQWSSGTITLQNTTASSTILYTSMTVTGSNGKTYQIAVDPTVNGFVATDADSSSGYYRLAAGASITVPIGSVSPNTATTAAGYVQQALASNAAANSITGTGTLPSGVSILSSSALVTAGPTSPAKAGIESALGNTSFLTDAQSPVFTTQQGYNPTEANVNTYNETIWSAQDLATWKGFVDNARAQGYLNLAPMMAEYEEGDFATSAATANIRAAALYSGGIAFDLPPWFFLARDTAFQKSTEAEIRWATANGLRSSITLSPQFGDDPNLLSDTKTLVSMLQAANAMPTQIVVKDGGATGNSVIYSNSDPNALNSVANWLSSLTLTPSNSESGLEVRGTSARPDDLMTGVAPSLSLIGGAALTPYAIAQVFAETKTTTGTLTVTLSSAALGRLVAASGLGGVSQNGTVFTASGTMAQLTAALQAMSFAAAAGVVGNGALTVTVTDAAGTITGQTAIAVDNLIALSGMPSTATVSGTVLAEQSLVVNAGNAATVLTATVTLSSPMLASFWNTGSGVLSDDGSTLTLVGNAATLQTALRQLETVMQVGAAGTQVETVSITDGTQTVSAVTTFSVTAATQLTAGGVPSLMLAGSIGQTLPFGSILVSNTANPNASLTATASLPRGAARLVAGAGGTVSADGSTFSVTGNAAQIEVALRGLGVSVPAGTASATEALTLSIPGIGTHVTMLQLGSTSTVFVGAPDGTMTGYSSSSVSSPLVSTGSVGLVDDYNGIVSTVVGGGGAALKSAWSGTAPGVFTFTGTSAVAQQTITVRNGGSGALSIPVGTLASTATGVQFQVVQSGLGNANWVSGTSGDGSLGSFVVPAGGSITLTVEALQAGYGGNVPANAITSLSGIAGATITGSAPSVLVPEVAGGTVTLTNTGSSTVNVYEGTQLSNSTGTYQIGNTPTANGYTAFASDNSNGYYMLTPGQSTTVAVYGSNALSGTASNQLNQILAQTTTATNTLSGTALPSGVVVSGSSAIAATGPATASQVVGWGGAGFGTGILTQNGYGRLVAAPGFGGSESSLFMPLSTNATAADLSAMQAYVDTLRGLGMMNVSIAVSGIQDFSSSAATANLRAAALYGGGIDLDVTPSAILSSGASGLAAIEHDIAWATQNGLRSTMTLRAYGDASFMDETKSVMTQLQAAGTLPSQVLVLGSPSLSWIDSSELSPAVAGYVATLGLTPTASESGLQTVGSTVDTVMTGVQNSESVVGTAPVAPYAVAQVYAQNPAAVLTATAALTSTVLGTLSLSGTVAAAATVSTDGSTVTLVGTQGQIDSSLAAIRYTPASGASGNTALNLSVTDTNGTITGQTKLAVGNPAVSVSVAAASTKAALDPALGAGGQNGTAGNAASTVTITTGSTSDALLATAGGAVTGNSFTVTGTAATDAHALSGLMLTPANGKVADLHITLAGSGLSFTDTNPGNDLITSSGGEAIHLSNGIDTVSAGLGDTISAGAGSVFASGSQNFTFLGGLSAADSVAGGAGGGTFTAGSGGRSVLAAGTGATTLNAAGANDTLIGGGASVLNGADNLSTRIVAMAGDTVNGAIGSIIQGPHGGTAPAIIRLGAGGETIIGDTGSMSVTGGAGASHLQLASGAATVTGGSGAEVVNVVGATHATLIDGTGAELVSLTKGLSAGAVLTLSGFSPAKDQLLLKGYGSATSGTGSAYSQHAVSGGTQLMLSDGATITLLGLSHVDASAIVLQ